MPRIRQHIPNFVDTGAPEETEFDTLEELLDIPWVKNYLDWEKAELFCRDDTGALMVGNRGHTWWWVVGFVTHKEILNSLPMYK